MIIDFRSGSIASFQQLRWHVRMTPDSGCVAAVRRTGAPGPGCVKTLRGIAAPGILRLVVTLRAKNTKIHPPLTVTTKSDFVLHSLGQELTSTGVPTGIERQKRSVRYCRGYLRPSARVVPLNWPQGRAQKTDCGPSPTALRNRLSALWPRLSDGTRFKHRGRPIAERPAASSLEGAKIKEPGQGGLGLVLNKVRAGTQHGRTTLEIMARKVSNSLLDWYNSDFFLLPPRLHQHYQTQFGYDTDGPLSWTPETDPPI